MFTYKNSVQPLLLTGEHFIPTEETLNICPNKGLNYFDYTGDDPKFQYLFAQEKVYRVIVMRFDFFPHTQNLTPIIWIIFPNIRNLFWLHRLTITLSQHPQKIGSPLIKFDQNKSAPLHHYPLAL